MDFLYLTKDELCAEIEKSVGAEAADLIKSEYHLILILQTSKNRKGVALISI